MRAVKGLCVILLALGCAAGLAACSDDDDDGAAADTADGGGTIIVEGDDADDASATPVVDDTAEGDGESDGDTAVALVAPELVSPRNGERRIAVTEGIPVSFEWTAVAGAASYIHEVDGRRRTVGGTSITVTLGVGVYRWRVSARDATGAAGPASGFFVLRII